MVVVLNFTTLCWVLTWSKQLADFASNHTDQVFYLLCLGKLWWLSSWIKCMFKYYVEVKTDWQHHYHGCLLVYLDLFIKADSKIILLTHRFVNLYLTQVLGVTPITLAFSSVVYFYVIFKHSYITYRSFKLNLSNLFELGPNRTKCVSTKTNQVCIQTNIGCLTSMLMDENKNCKHEMGSRNQSHG